MENQSSFTLSTLPREVRRQLRDVLASFPYIIMVITWVVFFILTLLFFIILFTLFRYGEPVLWEEFLVVFSFTLGIATFSSYFVFKIAQKRIYNYMRSSEIVLESEELPKFFHFLKR